MQNVTFISFAGSIGHRDPALFTRQTLLHESALSNGRIDRSIAWRRDDLLQSEFYRQHKEVLDNPRGCGYWAWKPWIILQTLEQTTPEAYVVYHDVGKPFRDGDTARGGSINSGNVIERPVHSIIRWAEQHDGMFPGVNTPHYGPASMWTKRDCFVGMDCDSEFYWSKPLVQAGYNAWKNTPRVKMFLTEWLEYCVNPAVVSDQPNKLGKPNFDDFNEHRHDQSILSNLIRKWNLTAFGSITESRAYVRNFNYLVRRNALDQRQESGEPTLTDAVRDTGGSRNLPISASTWVDLDLATMQPDAARVLWVGSRHHRERAALDKLFSPERIDDVDWSGIESGEITVPADEHILNSGNKAPYDFVFAIGFSDQVVLREIIQRYITVMKPLGLFIAGLDHAQIGAMDQTFASMISAMTQTRRLRVSQALKSPREIGLVIGTASNPIPMKLRDGQPIVVAIQRGIQ